MNIARYNQLFFGLIVSTFLVFFSYSFFVEPLDGDLTRIGGYNEADFGWEDEQAFFEQESLYDWAFKFSDWNQPYDIIVIGDSFGWRPYNSFTNYLVSMTGLKVLFLHHNHFKLDQVVTSPQFRLWPPKLLVYEVVERRLYRRIQGLADADLDKLIELANKPLSEDEKRMLVARKATAEQLEAEGSKRARGYNLSYKPRNKYFSTFNDRMAATIHFTKLQLQTTFFVNSKRAFDLELREDAPSLFSSRDQERILIYIDDMKFRNQWLENRRRFDRSLKAVKILGNANNLTKFVPIIFPDKLTIYAEYLKDDKWRNTSLIPEVSKTWDTPRIDLAYKGMVSDGIRDIYLPNDSHTGSAGNQIAAELILQAANLRKLDSEGSDAISE